MKNGKKLVVASLMAMIMLSSVALGADASTTKTTKKKTEKGTVESVSSKSLTLKVKSKTYKIDISSSTAVKDKDGKTMDLSNVKKDDSIKAKGKLTSTTMAASSVKDLSR